MRPLCINQGGDSGKTVKCPTCRGNVQLKIFICTLPMYKECIPNKMVAGVKSCLGCNHYKPRKP